MPKHFGEMRLVLGAIYKKKVPGRLAVPVGSAGVGSEWQAGRIKK